MKGLVGLVLIAASVAHADPDPAAPAEPAPTLPPPPPAKVEGVLYPHAGQFGVSMRVGVGLRGIATYSDKDYCGTTSTSGTGNAPVCIGRSPVGLDLEMSYGLSKKLDVLAEIRLGLEQDFGSSSTSTMGPHEVHLSPGVRYFFSEDKATKLFATAQVVFDVSDYKDVVGTSLGNDIGLRNLNGIWLDLHPAFGVYAFAGETLGFARWLEFELEIGVGIQARY